MSVRLRIDPSGLVASIAIPGVSFQSLADAVGQDEHALSAVGGSDFNRAEYAPRRSVTHACQVFDDVGQPQRDMSFDVFKETDGWPENPNSICDVRPQVPWIVFSGPLSCCRERLAGISAREDVHLSTKVLPWEGLKIRPDRCAVQESRFHFADQIRNCEGFDLRKSDRSQISDCSLESEINASVSGAKADVCNVLGRIHICVHGWFVVSARFRARWRWVPSRGPMRPTVVRGRRWRGRRVSVCRCPAPCRSARARGRKPSRSRVARCSRR